ncbi:MAG: ATP-binding protein [Chloroflexi bacterium]|nr:MAG: ATP-binding protein [Chloroflexota bacterium]MBL1197165.1 ATP-binding protein [Chloroflexota bacterium]NOH14459.1 ATP-binding protein [Chloroflexota bacterium]
MPTATFPGRFDSLAAISKFIIDSAKSAGLDDMATYDVELAVDEACCNIIEHAYGGEDKGEIECECEVTDEGLTVTLRDWGEAFDPKEIDEIDYSKPMEEIGPRGAGLMMIRKAMDDVEFVFGEDGNVLKISKKK